MTPKPSVNRQQPSLTRIEKKNSASAGTDQVRFSEDVIREIETLGVDVESLIERFEHKTATQRIRDPNAYLLRMARDEVAKRNGVTVEQVKQSTSRGRAMRIAAAVDATAAFSVPSDAAVARARQRGRLRVDETIADMKIKRFASQADADRAFESALERALWQRAGASTSAHS
ncbi:hypothetical protein RLW55_03175 [Hyphomicrobium sp. B1]|uniref:hypothetical protein n=1 Tax=Hyphomicrobium sp. B1 TaxID=3075651 RepID=UPI003C2AB11B